MGVSRFGVSVKSDYIGTLRAPGPFLALQEFLKFIRRCFPERVLGRGHEMDELRSVHYDIFRVIVKCTVHGG